MVKIVYLVYDDSRPKWDCVVGVFAGLDAAKKHAKKYVTSDATFCEEEERWEDCYGNSVWVDPEPLIE